MVQLPPHRIDVDAYLPRIGLADRPAADLAGLRALQVAHLTRVPFENLDILAGRRISLELGALEAKIVGAHRGGFCYELNGLFAALLEGLGFRVTRLAAQVWSRDEGTWGPPFDHLVLVVDLDGPWLVDVGFGNGFPEPMVLRDGAEVRDIGDRVFHLSRNGERWLLDERRAEADGPIALFRFDETPHELADYEPTCRWQETASPFFTAHRVIEIFTPDGGHTLYDDRLIVHAGGERTERQVTEAEVPELLRDLFGIVLPAGVSSALARP
jgi:N-hydroxyarylamine O-acetyltransferase